MGRWILLMILVGASVIPSRSGGGGDLEEDINDCLQTGACGVFPICSYSFPYDCSGYRELQAEEEGSEEEEEEVDDEEPCSPYGDDAGDDNDSEGNSASDPRFRDRGGRSDNGNEKRVKGNIVLLKNGLDVASIYKWEVIGHNEKIYKDYEGEDDSDLRTYALPMKSYAYIDTRLHFRHRIRLHNAGQVVDTVTSSARECTIHEACQYLSKVCQSSFAFSAAPSNVELRKRCKEYARACSYFVYEPDMQHVNQRLENGGGGDDRFQQDANDGEQESIVVNGGGSGGTNGNGGNNERDALALAASSDAMVVSLKKMRSESSQCIADCLWNYYPAKYLPPNKGDLREKIDSLWILRRVLLGLGLETDECSDVKFVDDRLNLFRTNEDENGEYTFVERDSNNTKSKYVAIISILVIILIVLLAGIVVYWVNGVRSGGGRYPWATSYSGAGGGGGGGGGSKPFSV